jgi:hypothetical protein
MDDNSTLPECQQKTSGLCFFPIRGKVVFLKIEENRCLEEFFKEHKKERLWKPCGNYL